MEFVTPIYAETVVGCSSLLLSNEGTRTEEVIVGNGFFAEGNHFFTASHVIADTIAESGKGLPYIKFNERKIELTLENANYYKLMPYDENGRPINHQDPATEDIAIYTIEGANSDYVLSDKLPEYGQVLKSAFYSKRTGKEELIETVGIIHDSDGFAGNFFASTMIPSHPTNGGSSGSPLYLGNKIYGILHGGGAEAMPDICVFFSSAKALKELKQNMK